MNCEGTGKLISLEIDGLLLEAEREALARHLQLCPDCSRKREQLMETARLLTSLDRTAVPRGFTQTVMAAIPSGGYRPAASHLRGTLAAALVGILGFIWLVLPLAGYGAGDYRMPLAEVEQDTEFAQANPAFDNVATQAVDFFDTLLDDMATVRFEFIIGSCLILTSVGLVFLYLINEGIERPLPTAALVRLRRAQRSE